MRTGRLLCALGFLALMWVADAPPAHAQSAEDEAFALFQDAKGDFDKGDFASAVDKLTRAYELFPQPVILLGKAEALENLGRIEEAYSAYAALKGSKFKRRKKKAMRRLQALLAKPVNVSILTGQVTGAQIFVDGVDTGKRTPAVLALPRGQHSIRIIKDGYPPFEKPDFAAKGTDTIVLDVPLKALTGSVTVRLESGSFGDTRVSIDGKLVPVPDPLAKASRPVELRTGEHELVCERVGAPRFFERFTLEVDEERIVQCRFPDGGNVESGGGSVVPAVITLVAGAAATGVGTWLLISYFDDVDFAESTNQKLESSKQIVGPVLMGVGVAAMVGSIFLWPSSSDDAASNGARQLPNLQLGVSPLPGGGAFSAVGRF